MKIGGKVMGAAQIRATLRGLGNTVGPALDSSSRYALKALEVQAAANAPKRSGTLARSLEIVRRRSPRYNPTHVVGPGARHRSPAGGRAIAYGYVTEFGRAPNKSGKGGFRGTRWMTRAFRSTANTMFDRFMSVVWDRIAARLPK